MNWDTNPARAYRTIVMVDGVERAHEPTGISWAQDITSDLPATVTAGGQVATRTGRVVWQSEGVSTRTESPWYAGPVWIPAVGDPVTVDVTDGTDTYRVFTGVIDTVEGDAFGRRSSKIVAPLNGAHTIMRRGSLTATGPALDGGLVRRHATTPVWLVSEIARELGYESVPPKPATPKLILDAPLQGSTYVYANASTPNASLVKSHLWESTGLAPVWRHGGDGFGISNATLEWVPGTGGGTGAGAVGVSLLVYSAHIGDATIVVSHGTADKVTVRVTGFGNLQISTAVNNVTNPVSTTLTVPDGDGPHRVSVVFRGGVVSVRVGESTETLAAPTPPGPATRVRLDALPGACTSGVQVWAPSTTSDHHAPSWEPTARYGYGTGVYPTVLTPSARDERAQDILEGYADALLSPLWVDGRGALQIVAGKALHELESSLTVDALRDVSDLSYTMALLDHRQRVDLTYQRADQTNHAAAVAKVPVWQGNGARITPGTPDVTFVEVPNDEEWIGLSDPASARQLLWPDGDYSDFVNMEGSWWGFRYESTSDTEFMSTQVSQDVETLTPWAWKTTSTTTDPNGVQATTPSQYSSLPSRVRDMDLPVWRARSHVKYTDATATVGGTSVGGGILTHDAGKWITTESAATSIATWLLGMVGTPTPVLENLRVRFDPRIDVGIKITVAAQAVFGADFEALVLSVEHDPGTDTTTITARVTRVTTYNSTLDDVDHAHIGQSLAYWDQARAGMTLDEVSANPYM